LRLQNDILLFSASVEFFSHQFHRGAAHLLDIATGTGDVAVMAPGTNTGAAHPVAMGVEMDAVMNQKVENDAAAYLRSICARRGRNSEVAETAVRQSKSFTEREARLRRLLEVYGSTATPADLLDMIVERLLDLATFTETMAGELGKPELNDHAAFYRRDAEAIVRAR